MTERNKLVFVIPSLDYGGAETLLINQVNFLYEHGYEPLLIVLSGSGELKKQLLLNEKDILFANSQFSTLTINSCRDVFRLAFQVSTFLSKCPHYTVIAYLPFAHFVMRVSKVLFKRKGMYLINYHHSMQYEESPLNSIFKVVFNKVHSLLALLADDKNILISKSVKENITNFFFVRNPVVIHNSIPLQVPNQELGKEFFDNNNIDINKFLIVIPGRLNEAKGQLFFLNCFDTFLRQNPSMKETIQVLFAGGGNLEKRIREELEEKGLGNQVYISGFVENKLMISLMSLASIVIIPSIYEGFGNVALEALMAGSLILSSDAGGLKEIISDGKNGFLFAASDEQSFLDKFNFIYQNKSREGIDKEYIKNDFIKRFSFSSHMEKFLHEINVCVE